MVPVDVVVLKIDGVIADLGCTCAQRGNSGNRMEGRAVRQLDDRRHGKGDGAAHRTVLRGEHHGQEQLGLRARALPRPKGKNAIIIAILHWSVLYSLPSTVLLYSTLTSVPCSIRCCLVPTLLYLSPEYILYMYFVVFYVYYVLYSAVLCCTVSPSSSRL